MSNDDEQRERDNKLCHNTSTDIELDNQRERIAADVYKQAEQYAENGAIRAVLYAVCHDIRSGRIGKK